MATLQCEIVSAEESLFSGAITSLSVRGTIGELGITPGHAPLLTGINPGAVTLQMEDGSEEVYFASGGYLEVQPGFVTWWADTALRAEDQTKPKLKKRVYWQKKPWKIATQRPNSPLQRR